MSNIRYKIEESVNKIRESFFRIFDLLFFTFSLKAVDKSPEKILIVRLDAIGDFVLWLDAARGYRELYPREKYQLTLLGNSLWTPLCEGLGIFDEVWFLDRRKFSKNLFYRIALLKQIRNHGFGIAIHPSYSRDFMFGDAVIRASNATERIGSSGDCSNIISNKKLVSDQWYTTLVPATSEPITELGRNAEFLRGLGLPGFRSSVPELSVKIKSPVSLDKYYVLFPGAGGKVRQWPLENFAQLAEKIYSATGWIGVVCGGTKEVILGELLTETAAAPLQNWAGRTSLQELVATIAQAQLLFSNDTSAVHIAAAVSTPSVCVLGGGHYGRFLPYRVEQETTRPLPVVCAFRMDCYGCNWDCPYCSPTEVAPCIARITVDEVWKAMKGLITAGQAADKHQA